MSRLYNRVWAIEVGPPDGVGTRYEGQTLQFAATYAGAGMPSTCDVALFMPAREVVAALYHKDTVCRILAGYQEEGPVEVFVGTPIKGSVTDRMADRDPAVTWQLSASRAHVAGGTLSRSWGDIRASEVIDYIRRELGLAADYIELPTDLRYARGHVVEGAPLPALAEVVADCGATYSIEGAKLRIFPIDGSVPGVTDLWSPETGLLDVAGPDGDGKCKATALLRPALRPGDIVPVQSPRWTGEIKAQSVKHEGQSDGAKWATSIVGVPRA